MGKLKLDLLKGIEEQEKAIDTSMANNQVSNMIQEETKKQVKEENHQIENAEEVLSDKKVIQTEKTAGNKNNKRKDPERNNKKPDEIKNSATEKGIKETKENQTITDTAQETNTKKKFINFDITDIDRYLTAVAGIYGKSKTKYLHDLVVTDMKSHPEISALIKEL